MNKSLFTESSANIGKTNSGRNTLSFLGAEKYADNIRNEFKALQNDDYRDLIADTGNMISGHIDAMGPLMIDITESLGTVLFAIDKKVAPLYQNEEFTRHFFAPTAISNQPLLVDTTPHIGIQRHFVKSSSFELDPLRHVSLGAINDDIQCCEVFLRNSDYVAIDLGVLRLADNMGSTTSTTAGLTTEQLCMIAKYIGASPKLKIVTIHGYEADKDGYGMMAKNVALIMWYLLEGFLLRLRESDYAEHKKTYTVIPDDLDSELLFIENVKTGRWWVQVHSDAAEESVDMPCTKSDYEAACQNEISDRLLSILSSV